MTPAQYDAWYDTPRGHWIGEAERGLLLRLLRPEPGWRLLDVGCGTGWFSRRFAADGHGVVGLDVDAASLAFARGRASAREAYVRADAVRLPFADAAFDAVISVTALCFVAHWPQAFAEIVRVARARFVVGLLHRRSALWLAKGRDGGAGAYRGAHWHTRAEIAEALRPLPVRDLRFGWAVFDPDGSPAARAIERMLPDGLALGSFIAVAGEVVR